MKISMALAGLLAMLSLAVPGRAQEPGEKGPEAGEDLKAAAVIQDWPVGSRVIARAMIEEYGEPREVSGDYLLWRNNGPWKRTVVHRVPPASWASRSEAEVLQQFVSYRVPLDKFAELAIFDSRIQADRARSELSFRSDSEKLNFLALNLANDIITGEKDAAQARLFYEQTAGLAQAGKGSPYTDGLRFATGRLRLTLPY